jgi:hypothetical protein
VDPADVGPVAAELHRSVPARFAGHPTAFPLTRDPSPRLRIEVTTVEHWTQTWTGTGPDGPETPLDWLSLPWQRLAEQAGGAIFCDRPGRLTGWRRSLAWYPDDLWRLVLAAQWQRIGEEEPFVGRGSQLGDHPGAAALTGRLAHELWRLALLLARRWPPYPKWLGTAAARLPGEDGFAGAVRRALAGPGGRDHLLSLAGSALARRQNALGLCGSQDPTPRWFHDRPFRVLDAGRFAAALREAITDPQVRALPPLGSVDQVCDAVPVLGEAGRCRALMAALLPADG